MGKGKRNRLNHFEDRMANPEKYKEKKPMPKWLSRTICVAVALLLLGAILLGSFAANGVFERNRTLVKSHEGYALNQQMATFIAWQNLYQSFYQEWYYAYYGLGSNKIDTQRYPHPTVYAIEMAGAYTTGESLRTVLETYEDYLAELVAGADAGVKAGLTLDENDQIAIDEMVDWAVSLQKSYMPQSNINDFLGLFVADGVQKQDVKKAAELMAMYAKYCDYKKYNDDVVPNENTLLTFIANNPAGHYKALYRSFVAENVEEAKKFEALKNVEEFTALVVDIMIERNFNDLILSNFAMPAANADKQALNTAKNNQNDKTALATKLTELGIVSTTYTKTVTKDDKGKVTGTTYNPTLDSTIAAWIFDSKRSDGEFNIVEGDDSIYLVYVFEKPATAEGSNTSTVKAGWKEYKIADFTDKVEGFKDALVKDLNSEKRENTTTHKSSDDLAKEIKKSLEDNKKHINNSTTTDFPVITAVKVGVTTVKPESGTSGSTSNTIKNTAPQAVLDCLYKENTTVGVNKFYIANASGTSYVIEVTKVDGTNYTVSYAEVKDSDYYAFFRAISAALNSAYPIDERTLDHPDPKAELDANTTSKNSKDKDLTFEKWISESELVKANDTTPYDALNFKRNVNDLEWFKVTKKTTNSTTNATTTTDTYTVYMVVEGMKNEKTEDLTAYGGYLKYNSEADANAAKDALAGKTGFALFHAFKALSVTTPAKTEDGEDTVTNATMSTAIEKDATSPDATVRDWFFASDRKADEVAVVKGKDNNFYLVYFRSTEMEWKRTIKDAWVADTMTEHLKELIKEGGYEIPEAVLNQIGKKVEEETTTAATK